MCDKLNGRADSVHIEQDKGSAGKNLVDQYSRNVLLGSVVVAESPTGNKEVRDAPLANALRNEATSIRQGRLVHGFSGSGGGFPVGTHKD